MALVASRVLRGEFLLIDIGFFVCVCVCVCGVQMVPDEADDLWLAYNLIAEGDTVLAVTVRKILREAASGGRDAERVKLKLEIKVEAMDYDKEGSVLRIRGKNILENEHVKIGAFHTLEIELHRPFVLRKEITVTLACSFPWMAESHPSERISSPFTIESLDFRNLPAPTWPPFNLPKSPTTVGVRDLLQFLGRHRISTPKEIHYCSLSRFVAYDFTLNGRAYSLPAPQLEKSSLQLLPYHFDYEAGIEFNILRFKYKRHCTSHRGNKYSCADASFVSKNLQEVWDSLALDVLRQASDPTASADLGVVLMQEGLASIFLVGKSVTTTRSRIEGSIPRKHGPAVAGYDKALNKFFENVLQAFLKHIDFKVVRCAVVASPGFTKDQFHRHLMLEAERRQLRTIIENKSRIILVHTTSGYKHSLREVLDAPNVMNMIKDTKAAQEDSDNFFLPIIQVRALKDFFTMLSNEPARACYGPKHVEVAHERMAVQTLLITDELFRNADVVTRKKYVNFVKSVKASGGAAHIFSSMHVSGEQLAQLTGIAAILRFPLPDLEDIEM
ncbi:hypothetical protein RHSIM_Rhsim09G0131200 [Rhododendron simsii]|uniref:eRF1/Pelota-like N-terminal domain-containing protein n=2 Tax=Magnoliopsida TaxID=3398 RepID=A0A834LG60_RHOSS|nr:hypothetical protein RHSIM_Rhsim09G0131200 [Rhododendron simsii]